MKRRTPWPLSSGEQGFVSGDEVSLEDHLGSVVVFLGINSRDENTAKVKAFEARLIDTEGRVAARVLGEIDCSPLYGVVEEVLGSG